MVVSQASARSVAPAVAGLARPRRISVYAPPVTAWIRRAFCAAVGWFLGMIGSGPRRSPTPTAGSSSPNPGSTNLRETRKPLKPGNGVGEGVGPHQQPGGARLALRLSSGWAAGNLPEHTTSPCVRTGPALWVLAIQSRDL